MPLTQGVRRFRGCEEVESSFLLWFSSMTSGVPADQGGDAW